MMPEKIAEIRIEGFDLISSRMKDLNKGVKTLSQYTGISMQTLISLKKGKNFLASTLSAVCDELGLKVVIMPDDDAKVEPHVRRKGGRRSAQVLVEPRKVKKPVPMKK